MEYEFNFGEVNIIIYVANYYLLCKSVLNYESIAEIFLLRRFINNEEFMFFVKTYELSRDIYIRLIDVAIWHSRII